MQDYAPERPEVDENRDLTEDYSFDGETVFNSDATETDKSYFSTSDNQNAILVSECAVSISNATIEKSGNAESEVADFYGTNAAVLAHELGQAQIVNSKITTNGKFANGIFAYGDGSIDIYESTISTSADNSGGIMVAGGGEIEASNLTVETKGVSSAAIRSDRGGGSITVKNGSYTTYGAGSPAVYSTATVVVSDAELTSNASEGVVIEGENSVMLSRSSLNATNSILHGNSETYKSIFIYQSMSGDAKEGAGIFSAKDSTITTNQGDHFFVTNTTAEIYLQGTEFTQNDNNGIFLRAQAAKWGKTGENGGLVTLKAIKQDIIGDISVDSISSIDLNLVNSYFKGAIVGDGKKELTISANSVFVLTGDTELGALSNNACEDDTDCKNENIYANGHTLTVNGQKVTVNQAKAPESLETNVEATSSVDSSMSHILWATAGLVLFFILAFWLLHRAKVQASGGITTKAPKKYGKKIDYSDTILQAQAEVNAMQTQISANMDREDDEQTAQQETNNAPEGMPQEQQEFNGAPEEQPQSKPVAEHDLDNSSDIQ